MSKFCDFDLLTFKRQRDRVTRIIENLRTECEVSTIFRTVSELWAKTSQTDKQGHRWLRYAELRLFNNAVLR